MLKPEISIIVPVYNKEDYLGDCLESLIQQSFKNIEILCIDDGSTDSSSKIIEDYAKTDSRIKIFSQNNNGPGSARNKGIINSTGEYLAFVDADDWIELDTMEILYNNAKKYDSDLVLFNAIEHLPDNKTNSRIYFKDKIQQVFNYKQQKNLVLNNYLIVCTKLHKKTFIKDNDIYFSEFGLFEDVYFHIKSVILADKISYLDDILYHYRRTQSNTRQSKSIKSQKSFIFFNLLEDIRELFVSNNIFAELEANYYDFKLTELSNLFQNIDSQYKNEFYHLLKKDFENDSISSEILKRLTQNKQDFYKNILSSENLDEYENIKDNSVKQHSVLNNKVKNLFKKFF